jgi:hypothetical protein
MKKVTIQKFKRLRAVLLVVFVGLSLFNGLFTIIYREALAVGDCELCFELNPEIETCAEGWAVEDLINWSDPDLNITIIDYEK